MIVILARRSQGVNSKPVNSFAEKFNLTDFYMIGALIVKGLTYSEEKIVNTILKTKNILQNLFFQTEADLRQLRHPRWNTFVNS